MNDAIRPDMIRGQRLASPAWWPWACAVLASLVLLWFFFPRVAMWRGMGVEEGLLNPEVNRAAATLLQLDNPWMTDYSESNRPLRWRLLFPLLGHYLHIPPVLLFSLAHLGCVLVLAYVAWWMQRMSPDPWRAFMAAGIAGASSWFCVSMGWLAYYDSWLILSLLVTAFSPARWTLVLAALLCPWVDERYVLALPLTLAVRLCWHAKRTGRVDWKQWLIDNLVTWGMVLPYAAIRVLALRWGDVDSEAYLRQYGDLSEMRSAPWYRFVEGIWFTFRAGWFFVGAAVWLCWRERGAAITSLLILVSVLTLALAMVVAADLTRNVAMLTPLLVMGLLTWRLDDVRRARTVLAIVLAANLLLPASHVVWGFREPIFNVHREWDRWRNPPDYLQAGFNFQRAIAFYQAGELENAFRATSETLSLSRKFTPALVLRALIMRDNGWLPPALDTIDRAIQIDPHSAEARMTRGVILHRLGERERAIDDLRRALKFAPADWPNRAACEQLLREWTGGITGPASEPPARPDAPVPPGAASP